MFYADELGISKTKFVDFAHIIEINEIVLIEIQTKTHPHTNNKHFLLETRR
jgi:hypothetical protein